MPKKIYDLFTKLFMLIKLEIIKVYNTKINNAISLFSKDKGLTIKNFLSFIYI